MECYSMHSSIGTEKKSKKVYTMEKWKGIMKDTRCFDKNGNRHPYEVHILSSRHFSDLKSINLLKNRTKHTDGEKVNWQQIKGLKFVKEHEHLLYYRYHPSHPYKTIDIRGSRLSRTPDLMKLCKDVIPTT